MPLFGKKSNANSANRRAARAKLLLNNKNLLHNLETALFYNRPNKYFTKGVIRQIRAKWPKNLVPFFNANLENKLRQAYKQIRPVLNQRNKNAAAARQAARKAEQANKQRKANQHAKFLLTNEGKQWQRQNNEKRRLQQQRNRANALRAHEARSEMYAAGGYGPGINVYNRSGYYNW